MTPSPILAAGACRALPMPARRRWAPALALLGCLLPAALAAGQRAAQSGVDSGDALQWLSRMQSAARSANYEGTLVFSAGGTLSSSRVWHYCVGEQTYERIESLDGRQQNIVRHNETLHTLWPQSKMVVVEKRETPPARMSTPQAVDPQALEMYELRREGSARIAGRDAAVLLLQPRDALRFTQRLWADLASGLLLRADVFAAAADGGSVLESSAFSEVAIGIRPQPQSVLQAARKVDGWRTVRPPQARTTLEAEGWALARPVPGFRLSSCVRRGMAEGADEAPVLQSVFSDGLTHVSVFIEGYRPHLHRAEMQARQGATSTLTLRRGEHWLTLVGDVPTPTLKLFADALQRQRP